MKRKQLLTPSLLSAGLVGLATLTALSAAAAEPLMLSRDGATDYVIVTADETSAVDRYAAAELASILERITGAGFPVKAEAEWNGDTPALFIGLGAQAQRRLEETGETVADPKRGHAVFSRGSDLFLYGAGRHGNYNAAMDFAETDLNYHWFSRFEAPVYPSDPDLQLQPLERRRTFAFRFRQTYFPNRFDYHHGINMGFSERNARLERDGREPLFPEGVESKLFNPEFVHATYNYIPATPDHRFIRQHYEWVTNRNYFATNPEYFSMNAAGERTSEIIYCFSNPGLRRELTAHILEHIRRLGETVGEDVVIMVDTQDGGGKLCHCAACAELEAAYATPGGSLFDYLFALCDTVAEIYPRAWIRTGASRPEKTRIPPTLPPGREFPENLIVVLANLGDRLDRDWSHPDNLPNYEALRSWTDLTPNVWTWYYPNPYGRGGDLPFAGIRRLVADLRRKHAAGVQGAFLEFTTPSVHRGEGFVELQKYLYYQLMKDINRDETDLIEAFTDAVYGPAAELVRRYLDELEDAHADSAHRLGLTPVHIEFERTFAYLTTERVRRWHTYFDRMETLLTEGGRPMENVRRLRLNLELATLANWHALTEADPDYFPDYRAHVARSGRFADSQLVSDFETRILAGNTRNSLPPALADIPSERIVRLVPVNYRNLPGAKVVLDPEAAFGFAATVDDPDLPFNFGFHPRAEASGSQPQTRRLSPEEIVPDVWQLYELGPVTVTPRGIIWFSSKSWMTHLLVGEQLYAPPTPENDNRYQVYVTLKFSGPTYGGAGAEDQVLVDQIILIADSLTQFE